MAYKIHVLSQDNLLCGEGPVWDRNNERLYWTESLGRDIYSYDNENQNVSIYHQGLKAASLALHKNGGLVVSGQDGFSLLLPDKRIRKFNISAEGTPASNLNDIIADPRGGVFGGQEAFAEGKKYDPGYLFRLDSKGILKIVAEDIHLSNGMGFSPDCRTFYLVDTILRNIYQFDYNVSTGEIANRKVLVAFNKEQGLPDGMTVDRDGFLWVAMFFGSKIIRLDPDGTIEQELKLPCTQPTSVTFGGKNLNELFITSAGLDWKTNYAPTQHDYGLFKGGSTYRIKTDFQGKEEFTADI